MLLLCTPPEGEIGETVEPGPHRMRASLQLAFARDNALGETTLTFSHQEPPLRVLRAFHPEKNAALAHLLNVSGGLFGGDDLTLKVHVGKGAQAQLTTTGATRVYRCGLHNAPTRQHNEFTVAESAVLEYVPDAIIPFAGANFYQRTDVRLSDGAGLFWWEILAPGREASDEVFAFERIEMHSQILAYDELISIDRIRLEPGKKPLAVPGRMGRYRYSGTFYICKVGADPQIWLDLERQLRATISDLQALDETLWGFSTLKAHGLTIRCLAKQGRDVIAGLHGLWDAGKFALYGHHAVRPRKMH